MIFGLIVILLYFVLIFFVVFFVVILNRDDFLNLEDLFWIL